MVSFGLLLGVLSARVPQWQRGICQGAAQPWPLLEILVADSGLAQLVDLYRMAVENVEIVDTRYSSRSFESTLVGRRELREVCERLRTSWDLCSKRRSRRG